MRKTLIAMLTVTALAPLGLFAQKESSADDRLTAAADVIQDMTHEGDKGIPQDLLNRARCVIVVPNMKKAGFIFGAQYGRGFAVCRRQVGWTAPAAIRMEGGSFGLQIGGSESDAIVLVMNERGMNRLLTDKFTLGGDASIAAGPIGRDASAQTDVGMNAEMLSYSRSRGLFAGITLNGATLRPDHPADKELYGREASNREILTGDFRPPAGAAKLEAMLDRDSAVHH
jgi:lipid-binding SYLF domain-containing protein